MSRGRAAKIARETRRGKGARNLRGWLVTLVGDGVTGLSASTCPSTISCRQPFFTLQAPHPQESFLDSMCRHALFSSPTKYRFHFIIIPVIVNPVLNSASGTCAQDGTGIVKFPYISRLTLVSRVRSPSQKPVRDSLSSGMLPGPQNPLMNIRPTHFTTPVCTCCAVYKNDDLFDCYCDRDPKSAAPLRRGLATESPGDLLESLLQNPIEAGDKFRG